MKSMIPHLSVLSRSLILATVLGFSLSLVSAPSLISLLLRLPRNTPPPLSPSFILTITTRWPFLTQWSEPGFTVLVGHPRKTLSSRALTPANLERRWVLRSASRGDVRRRCAPSCTSSHPPVPHKTPPPPPSYWSPEAALANTTPHFAALFHNFADNLPLLDTSALFSSRIL